MSVSQSESGNALPHHMRVRALLFMFKLAAIAALVAIANSGFFERILLLIVQDRFITLAGFLGVWGLSLVAILVAAFQPNLWLRIVWAAVIAVTTAVGFSFRLASGTDFTLLDAVSLWSARHEAARALAFYSGDFQAFLLVLACGFVALALPPRAIGGRLQRLIAALAWVPALPVAVIAAIIVVQEGGGAQALPIQFAPLSVGAVAGWKVATVAVPERKGVVWTPGQFEVRKIVLIVDESVRGDFIDWTSSNPFTPELASLKSHIVDFGPAASGGNCSHYSNALLRFAAARNEVGPKLLTNPTIWQYAKKAGFRTVFVDAQAAFNRNPGKLQNFMTAKEASDIDGFYALDAKTPTDALDDRLLDVVMKELRLQQPVLIYAVKNGAHFPYDRGYPATEAQFHPTMTQAVGDDAKFRINSYRNVVRWSVDRFFKRLFEEADLSDSVIIYTSDHGQSFNPQRLTHCTIENPDPREALVPLFVIPAADAMRVRFEAAAKSSQGRSSHFSIAPTILELLGYRRRDVASIYQESLLGPALAKPAFTTGDIFGLFSSHVRWHPIDLSEAYRDPVPGPGLNLSRRAGDDEGPRIPR